MEIEDNSNADVTEELVIAAPTFQINLEIIESVEIENQSEELRSLGLTVYDQSKFEEGILKQVDDALEEQERLKSSKKTKTTKKNASSAVNTLPTNGSQNITDETEKEKLVRLGQMTPFGTMLHGNKISQELTSFEKYLLEQEKLRKEKSKQTSKKGKALKSTGSSKEKVAPVLQRSTKKTSSSSPNKKKNSEGPAGKTRKRKKSKKDSEEEWNSDDSDWEYSDEELSNPSKKKKKNRPDRVTDDGNLNDYQERIKTWQQDDDIDCEEFEGGLKIPLVIWDQVIRF